MYIRNQLNEYCEILMVELILYYKRKHSLCQINHQHGTFLLHNINEKWDGNKKKLIQNHSVREFRGNLMSYILPSYTHMAGALNWIFISYIWWHNIFFVCLHVLVISGNAGKMLTFSIIFLFINQSTDSKKYLQMAFQKLINSVLIINWHIWPFNYYILTCSWQSFSSRLFFFKLYELA